MSKIFSLKISHYRGIECFEQTFGDKNCIVLIGRGDSGKSTILKAIASILSPVWNTTFSDLDFTNRDTSTPIVMEAVVFDVPEELLKIEKYGQYIQLLKGNDVVSDLEDPDADQEKKVLKVRLTVDDTLEPKWTIISDREIGNISFAHGDRAKLNMFMVSDYVDNHFSYSKGSPLYSTFRKGLDKEHKKAPEKRIVEIVRTAYETIRDANVFTEFDEATNAIKASAHKLGLSVDDLYSILEFKDNAYSESNISLHSSNIPFRLCGKGSKRLLSIAIQYGLVEDGGVILIDELEQGLESDRARNLTRLLSRSPKGQVFITTHSKDVVLEPSADQIFLMTKGSNRLLSFNVNLQGVLRSQPAAFFARRIICCEGATEEGIIRSFSDYLQETRGYGIAVQGIVHIDGSGSSRFYELANHFYDNGIDTMVFCDDDVRKLDEIYECTIAKGIKVVKCDKDNAIEQQLFQELPWEAVCELVAYAIEEHAGTKVVLPLQGFSYKTIDELVKVPSEEHAQLRAALAKAAKANTDNGAWFKNMHHGEKVGRIWIKYLDQLPEGSTLFREYSEIMAWIGNDIK